MSKIIQAIIDFFKKLFGLSPSVDLPTGAFPATLYGMNLHDKGQTTEALLRCLKGSGLWLRYTVPTDEVAEENWYRLDPLLARLREARASYPGLKLTITLTGWSGYPPNAADPHAADRLYRTLSDNEAHNRYYNLAYRLAKKLAAERFAYAVIEAWNEPDHEVYGIGLPLGDDFITRLTALALGFARGVWEAGGCGSAFPSFMSMNASRFDYIQRLWAACGSQYDYFNVHMYDESPQDCYEWAAKVADLTGDKPALITEHGDQHNKESIAILRGQAWAFQKAFGDRLAGVLGYAACSDHAGWAIAPGADREWKVTHDQNPF